MDTKALDKSRRRLRVAEEATAAMAHTKDFAEYGDRWYVFLHAAKGVYTTLEQGAKTSAQSRQWFGARNAFRRADPLLRFISEARNDDEHGIDEPLERVPARSDFGVATPESSSVLRDRFGNVFMNCGTAWSVGGELGNFDPGLTALDGKPVKNVFSPEKVALKPVRDRNGHVYEPPREHLGQPLEFGDPLEAARLALKYLDNLLAEAAEI